MKFDMNNSMANCETISLGGKYKDKHLEKTCTGFINMIATISPMLNSSRQFGFNRISCVLITCKESKEHSFF